MASAGFVTLEQVAERAGVSVATASRAINGSRHPVGEASRRRVEAAAAELGYMPNRTAQSVARGESSFVAVVVNDIADPYFSSIASGVVRGAGEAGLFVNLASSGHSTQTRFDLVSALRGQRPRAIIVIGTRVSDDPCEQALDESLAAYAAAGGGVVLVAQGPDTFDRVEMSNFAGASSLAEALVARGGVRFGVVSGHRRLRTNSERVDGFCAGLRGAGVDLPEDAVVESEFSRDGGYEGMRVLLSRVPQVDTVFATSDVMAFGAATALRDHGLEPGRDVSIAGFDDIAMCRDVTPAMSSVSVPLADVGYRALRLALRERTEASPMVVPVGTTVVLRESTPERQARDRTVR